MGLKIDATVALKFNRIVLHSGETFINYLIDYLITSPPNFIAIRPIDPTPDGRFPIVYVKIANIDCFEIDESEQTKMWDMFQWLPETVMIKTK